MQTGYPRPQLRRERWQSLDGSWEFALDSAAAWSQPEQVEWNRQITVPFAPETPASGIGETGYFRACWYRRAFADPCATPGERLLLHFGAVDYEATVWVNGRLAVCHEGGYTPFSADITDLLTGNGEQEIVVRAEDDPHDLAQPRGKQDWKPEPHAIWYLRTTGIWQTVWLEPVPRTRIDRLRWTPNLERWEIGLDLHVEGDADGHTLEVELRGPSGLLAADRYRLIGPELSRRIALIDPGIDDARNALLWRPGAPTLIDVELTLRDPDDNIVDQVASYTAMRAVGTRNGVFELNGRPLYLRMALDQGYWPETGLTAPDDDALRRDVELALEIGLNGVRKHQKIEDPRYLAWADRLGLLVWEELPSAYRFTPDAVQRLTRTWMGAIERDVSHPCIVAWVPINESWGVPDLPASPAQRDFVQALYHVTKALDPTRPVIGNDGWEQLSTDIFAIHDYDGDVDRIARRYAGLEVIPHLLERERPGRRVLTIDGHPYAGQPIMLTEFGGIAFTAEDARGATWGYRRSDDIAAFERDLLRLFETVRSRSIFAGFCYTQFTDTYQEANGLLTMDRTPKLPLETIRHAITGA